MALTNITMIKNYPDRENYMRGTINKELNQIKGTFGETETHNKGTFVLDRVVRHL